VPDIPGTPVATALAFERRDELVFAAAAVKAVTDPTTAEQAGNALKNLKAFSRDIDDKRTEVKRPIIALGKAIESLAAELTEAVEAEAKRISRLLGDYQLEVQRKQREAEEEARKKEQAILEEQQRKAQAAIDSGRNVEGKLEKIEAQTFEKVALVRAEAAAPVAPKIAGVATRQEVKFEVTDLAELYKARPELVKLEANTAAIKAVLKANPKLQLPGLRHWTEAATIVR
jgi:hypothetical protein